MNPLVGTLDLVSRTSPRTSTLLRGLLCAVFASLPTLVLALEGVVVDANTGQPIPLAHVVFGDTVRRTDPRGGFSFQGAAEASVSARAPGYLRHQVSVPADGTAPVRIALTPFRPKALYLSVFGIGDSRLRGDALQLMDQTELNALVIDIKGDRTLVPYRSAAYAAAGIGTQSTITVRDMPAMVKSLHERGVYLIGRIVTFKDDRVVAAHPEWAVRDANGAVWHDREGLAWVDPMRREGWAFPIALAEEAAQLGFDEVQFDYVRFPDALGLRFDKPNTEDRRIAAITGFLDAARARLSRYNVFIGADVFGYICWNQNDTQIGQQLEALADRVDYLAPMLYPSGFSFGIAGHRQPVAEPFPIVEQSLQQALKRTGLSGNRFRPWLQSFRDYAFDRRTFGAQEIRAQIDAAEATGSDGWMLWNAQNHYSTAGLKTGRPSAQAFVSDAR